MRYIDADNLPRHGNRGGVVYWRDIEAQPTADVVEVGKWCNMREYILELQAGENGHNEFFRIIKLDDEGTHSERNRKGNSIRFGYER